MRNIILPLDSGGKTIHVNGLIGRPEDTNFSPGSTITVDDKGDVTIYKNDPDNLIVERRLYGYQPVE